MPKIYSTSTVKHNGITYPPNTPFTVGNCEVADLKRKGCGIVEEPTKEPAVESIVEPVIKKTRKKQNDSAGNN